MENQTQHKTADRDALAKQYGFSREAVTAAQEALAHSGGKSAQFSNAELGGSVQWMSGGMLQIGDMFNADLKARVGHLLEDLSKSPAPEAHKEKSAPEARTAAKEKGDDWWPKGLGAPSTVGGQNDHRYAFFADTHRLVVEESGRQTVYDTGAHRITGAAQGQGTGEKARLTFSSADGAVVDVAKLSVVEG